MNRHDSPAEEAKSLKKDNQITIASVFPTTLADLNLTSNSSSTLTGETHTPNQSIYKTLNSLRKSTLGIPNRLRSVLEDAEFVQALWDYLNDLCPVDASANTITSINASNNSANDDDDEEEEDSEDEKGAGLWPLIPNERSGSWPLHPALKLRSQMSYLSCTSSPSHPQRQRSQPVSAYFKSTDGHINQWSFSLRRLNLPVLSLLGHNHGSVLIDTTRRGKSYPDALRRTVPIYTAVWNRVLFPEFVESDVCAFQPFELDASESLQIEVRIPKFVSDLKGLGLDFEDIKRKVKRPIRCVWLAAPPTSKRTRETAFAQLIGMIDQERRRWQAIGGVNILICCSASRRVVGAEMSEDGYIQGSGDDSEGWSHGLTAKVFWDNKDQLMDVVKDGGDIEELVDKVVDQSRRAERAGEGVLVKPTRNLYLNAGTTDKMKGDFDLVIDCNASAVDEETSRLLCLGCKDGKLGSKMLRDKLQGPKKRVEDLLRQTSGARVLVTCSTGKDLSVGVLLALLCTLYSEDGTVELGVSRSIDKKFVKQRLAWISSAKPDANPSRATLQAVNSFLMDRPG